MMDDFRALAESAESSNARPATPPPECNFAMSSADLGNERELERDAARTFSAGCVYVLVDRNLRTLTSPDDGALESPGSTAAASIVSQIAVLVEMLRLSLPHDLPDEAFERLLPMLTVNPILLALAAAGEIPAMQQRCCVVHAAAPGELYCTVVGIVSPPSPQPENWGMPWDPKIPPPTLLVVRSPNLLAPAEDRRSYDLTFALRPSRRTNLAEEVLEELNETVEAVLPGSPQQKSVDPGRGVEAADTLCSTALVRTDGRYVLRTIKDERCGGCAVCQPHRVMDL